MLLALKKFKTKKKLTPILNTMEISFKNFIKAIYYTQGVIEKKITTGADFFRGV